MNRTVKITIAIATLLAVFVAGYLARGHWAKGPEGQQEQTTKKPPPVAEVWTCSMHPQIRRAGPGKCPICNMNLIPVKRQGEDLGPRQIKLSAAAVKLASVQVAPVERRHVVKEVHLAGKVEFDETRLAEISARVAGRLDRLYVDYTGVPVKKGDHLVSIYSPDLLSAQEELLQALKTLKELEKSELGIIRDTAKTTIDAAREKLRLWGLTPPQVATIEKSGKTTDHLTIYSPLGGIVIKKHVNQGAYVKEGTRIYTIADLSRVWVKLDAYESDLVWLRYGQEVEFRTEAYPGEVFKGRITFIDPVLNPRTRTVKVRVNVPNTRGKLKPEMFVRARAQATVAAAGKVIAKELAGKWICPMHPEIVKDQPGRCDICQMPLVKAEDLGYVAADELQAGAPLIIPASAPLITGKRAVVYVQVKGRTGVFEGRQIELGPRAGDYYLVKSGLTEGELVVVNGNFKLDSALQILAKPSMMNPEGGVSAGGHQHGQRHPQSGSRKRKSVDLPAAFRRQLRLLYAAYFKVSEALSQDKHGPAKTAAGEFLRQLAKADMKLLAAKAHKAWMPLAKKLKSSAGKLAEADSLSEARKAFANLSVDMIMLARHLGAEQKLYVTNCPMAFDNAGADWLQTTDKIANPYFGARMLRCGEVKEILPVESAPGTHRK